MADVPNSAQYIQNEEVDFRSPLSESTLQKIAGSINYLLDSIEKFAVGEVVSADLTEAQFQTQTSTSWVLCDGRSVTGTVYSTLTGNTTIPDLRGIFFRGKNNGRSDGNENPDGDTAIGTYQADAYASHTHGMTKSHNLNTYDTRLVAGSAATFPNVSAPPNTLSVTLNSNGSNETRGLCITENFFIKIN